MQQLQIPTRFDLICSPAEQELQRVLPWQGTEHPCPWCSLFVSRPPQSSGRSHLPVIKAAGPHQKQSSHGHPALLFNRGEAAGEIYEEYEEKRDIPATTNTPSVP